MRSWTCPKLAQEADHVTIKERSLVPRECYRISSASGSTRTSGTFFFIWRLLLCQQHQQSCLPVKGTLRSRYNNWCSSRSWFRRSHIRRIFASKVSMKVIFRVGIKSKLICLIGTVVLYCVSALNLRGNRVLAQTIEFRSCSQVFRSLEVRTSECLFGIYLDGFYPSIPREPCALYKYSLLLTIFAQPLSGHIFAVGFCYSRSIFHTRREVPFRMAY